MLVQLLLSKIVLTCGPKLSLTCTPKLSFDLFVFCFLCVKYVSDVLTEMFDTVVKSLSFCLAFSFSNVCLRYV